MRCLCLTTVLLLAACAGEDVQLEQAKEMGLLETTTAVKGRDGGYSGLVFGRSVWLYGDTILSLEGEDGSSWRHNSWSFTTDTNAADGLGPFEERVDDLGAPRPFFAGTAEERAFNAAHAGEDCEDPCGARRALWPGALIWDAEGSRALVFYHKIYGEPGPWNFYGLGSGVAIWTDFEESPVRPEPKVIDGEPTLLFSADEGSFGAAALIHDGFLYAYACDGGLDKPCLLGRVPPGEVEDRSAWKFYADDGTWIENVADADPVFDGAPMLDVHYNEHLRRFLALYSRPLSNDVVVRTAPAPEGPWSSETQVFEMEPQHNGDPAYAALAHPELMEDGGRIEYFTYYRGTGDWTGELRVVRLELSIPE